MTNADVTDRAALAMFDRCRDGLSQVQNVLVDGGYTGKLCHCSKLVGSRGGSGETSELHTFVVLPKRFLGGGAVFRLAGKVLAASGMRSQPANGGARLHGANPKKIAGSKAFKAFLSSLKLGLDPSHLQSIQTFLFGVCGQTHDQA